MNKEETKYLELLQYILDHGEDRQDRTGVGTKSIFGSTLRFSLENDTLPLLTTKRVFMRGVIEELLFFIRGETDTKKLEAKGVNIWKGNTSREFLNKRGLGYLPEGSFGKSYGVQWRKFGQDDGFDIENPAIDGVDQLKQVFESLKNDPFSRRHIVAAWNPQQLNEMALPPCHYSFQFYVSKNNELSLLWNQRSVDTFLGLGFNISSYAVLTHIFAKALGYKAKEIILMGGDSHLYNNHLDQVKEQILRKPFPFPQIQINKEISSIKDMELLEYTDFEIINYKCHPAISAPMAI